MNREKDQVGGDGKRGKEGFEEIWRVGEGKKQWEMGKKRKEERPGMI